MAQQEKGHIRRSTTLKMHHVNTVLSLYHEHEALFMYTWNKQFDV